MHFNPELQHVYELLGGNPMERAKNMDRLVAKAGMPCGGMVVVRGITEQELKDGKNGVTSLALPEQSKAELYDMNNAVLFEVLRTGPRTAEETDRQIENGDLITAPNNCIIPMMGSLAPGSIGVVMPKAIGVVLPQANILDACRSIAHEDEMEEEAARSDRLANLGIDPMFMD